MINHSDQTRNHDFYWFWFLTLTQNGFVWAVMTRRASNDSSKLQITQKLLNDLWLTRMMSLFVHNDHNDDNAQNMRRYNNDTKKNLKIKFFLMSHERHFGYCSNTFKKPIFYNLIVVLVKIFFGKSSLFTNFILKFSKSFLQKI